MENSKNIEELNSVITVKSTYFPLTEEVLLETKRNFSDVIENTMFKIRQLQDRVLLNAIPNDTLTQLYLSIQTEMQKRGLKL